jgi:exonuclease SbcD
MRFSFIHAADLHIDSPLAALGRKNADAAVRFADAGRKAVTALIDETLANKAAFLIIAGDIFDGDWTDYTTGLFFIGELAKLDRAGVPVFILRGNHDAESKMSRSLRNWPANVHLFSARKAESFDLPELQTVLHGKSFPERNVPDDFVQAYPKARPGWLNIGVLHTALDGVRGHASYAPCTEDDLRRFGYDYWALGHIHKPEVVARDPWIVFPGNIQGRSVRETGARGAMRVEVEDGQIVSVEPVTLDQARWAMETLDIGVCPDEDALDTAIAERLRVVHDDAGGRPLALRLVLTGATPLHGTLAAEQERIAAECQALAARLADDFWIESLRLATQPPARVFAPLNESDALDVEGLLRQASEDPAFAETLAGLAGEIGGKLPRDLAEEFALVLAGEPDGEKIVTHEAQALLLGLLQKGRTS